MPMVLGLIIAMTIIFSAVAGLVMSNITLVSNNIKSQKALNIAEAGINYYLWHLSHNATDFRDGKSTPATPDPTLGYGPYTHNYVDDFAKTTGTYTLWILPQGTGSTIMKVRSIGKIDGTTISRTVEATLGAPSFASYGLLADVALWFGNTESANGPVFSNQGIRMDGPSSTDVVSARTTYTPPSNLGGDGSSKPGVWCHPSVTAPINCSTRSKTDWLYPSSAIDFNQLSGSLCTLKKLAFQADASTSSLAGLSNACSQTPSSRTPAYLPQRSATFNTTRGYLIQLNTNATYNLYDVNGENDRLTPYTSALTLQSVATNIPIPSSGVIFAEDNVWVRTASTFSGRVTVGAGRLASATNSADITIADDILYSTKNGSDAIGLIAENNVYIAPYAPPASGAFTFEVDAALIAQSGSVTYPGRYKSNSSLCTRGWKNSDQIFNYYGSIATRQTWTWLWWLGGSSCGDAVNNSGNYISGFVNNATQYDYNLLYAPPPSFPITSTYNILSWREVLTHP